MATVSHIDPMRHHSNFQILAFDYIIDENFNLWLLKIKDSPFPESNSPVIDRVVPNLIEQTLRFIVEPLLPPRNHYPPLFRHRLPPDPLASLKFELFFEA
jgi:tubulin polyglutamylase TTLL1